MLPPYESKNPIIGYLLILAVLAILIPVAVNSGWWTEAPMPQWMLVLSIGWGLAWMIFLLIFFRRVQAYPDRLVVKSLQEQEDIDYRHIEWIFEMPNRRGPSYSVVRYSDAGGLSSRIIVFIPVYFGGRADSPMTEYIRNQIIRVKPDYSRAAEPSPWKVYALFMLIVVATFLLAWFVDSSI